MFIICDNYWKYFLNAKRSLSNIVMGGGFHFRCSCRRACQYACSACSRSAVSAVIPMFLYSPEKVSTEMPGQGNIIKIHKIISSQIISSQIDHIKVILKGVVKVSHALHHRHQPQSQPHIVHCRSHLASGNHHNQWDTTGRD